MVDAPKESAKKVSNLHNKLENDSLPLSNICCNHEFTQFKSLNFLAHLRKENRKKPGKKWTAVKFKNSPSLKEQFSENLAYSGLFLLYMNYLISLFENKKLEGKRIKSLKLKEHYAAFCNFKKTIKFTNWINDQFKKKIKKIDLKNELSLEGKVHDPAYSNPVLYPKQQITDITAL